METIDLLPQIKMNDREYRDVGVLHMLMQNVTMKEILKNITENGFSTH